MHSNGTKVGNNIHLSEKLATTARQKQTRPLLFIKIKFDTKIQNFRIKIHVLDVVSVCRRFMIIQNIQLKNISFMPNLKSPL